MPSRKARYRAELIAQCPYTVVIVDRHRLLLDALAAWFAAANTWTVIGKAVSAEEARAVFRSLPVPPDAVLIDMGLQPESLTELIQWLRAHYAGFGNFIPAVLVCSDYDDATHVNAAMKAGAMGYICKNDGGEELKIAMRKLLEKKTYLSRNILSKLTRAQELLKGLTKREQEIFALVQQGYGNGHIGEKLSLKLHSVENYLSGIYGKMKVKSREELQKI
jgi:DNA-binding NarL/FixJ family response regulator